MVAENPVLPANQLARDAAAAVVQSEYVGRILYEFGKDTALAIRTAKQSPAQQLITVGKIMRRSRQRKLPIQDEGTALSPMRNLGNRSPSPKHLPRPPRYVGGGRAVARDITDPNMSVEEFARQHRWANSQPANSIARCAG